MGVGYDVKEEKSRLRRELRQRLANVTDSERREEGKKVCEALMTLPEVKEASTIMAYWAMPNELPVEDFVEACVRAGKRVALPVVKGSGNDWLRFHRSTYWNLAILPQYPHYKLRL